MNISVCVPLVKKLTQSRARGAPLLPACQRTGNVKGSLLSQLSVYFSFQRRALYIAAALQSLGIHIGACVSRSPSNMTHWTRGKGGDGGEQLYFQPRCFRSGLAARESPPGGGELLPPSHDGRRVRPHGTAATLGETSSR